MLPSPRPLVSLTLAFAAGVLLAANAAAARVADRRVCLEFSFLLLFWGVAQAALEGRRVRVTLICVLLGSRPLRCLTCKPRPMTRPGLRLAL